MKRLTAILMALSLAFPAWAAAELDVNMEQKEENGQTLTVFSAAAAGAAETTAAPEETPDPAIATANALIEARFEQTKAAQLTQRAGAEIIQSGETHTLGNVACAALERHTAGRHGGKRRARAGARPDDRRGNPPGAAF